MPSIPRGTIVEILRSTIRINLSLLRKDGNNITGQIDKVSWTQDAENK